MIKCILLGLANFSMMLLGIPILAITYIFLNKEAETLPKALRWWDNGEIYFKAKTLEEGADGLMGPDYWRRARGTLDKNKLSWFKIWWERFYWTALRNPADYFGYLIGLHVKGSLLFVSQKGSVLVGDHIWNEFGVYKLKVRNGDGKEYTEYYRVTPHITFKGHQYALRARIGWKIRDYTDDKDGDVIPFVFSINPFKRID